MQTHSNFRVLLKRRLEKRLVESPVFVGKGHEILRPLAESLGEKNLVQ